MYTYSCRLSFAKLIAPTGRRRPPPAAGYPPVDAGRPQAAADQPLENLRPMTIQAACELTESTSVASYSNFDDTAVSV